MDIPPKKNIDNEKDESNDNTNQTEKIEDQTREDAKKSALERLKQKATIVNVDELAENEARKAADAYMTESQGKAGFFKKLWKHTFFDEYYRQREVNRVKADIKKTDNIYIGRIKDGNKIAHENTMKAVSERFTSEYEGTLTNGEDKRILDDKDSETIKARTDIKNLIDSYAMSRIDDGAFVNEKNRIISELKQVDLLKGANNYADNLFEIAKNARLAVEHGAKMEELDYDLDIVVGKAKSSLKTEAHFNWVDKGIDKMKKSKIGRFISPAVLSTAVGIAYSLSVGLGKKVMSSKAAAFVSLGGSVAVSAIFAGMNESQRVALERKQHGIEMAEGGSVEAGDKRREQMQRYQYEMESSNDLAQNLRDLMFEKDKNGNDVVRDIKKEDIDIIIASLSEIDARKGLNVRKKIDLISYSNIANVEKESTDLTILTARAKAELRKRLEGDLKDGIKDGKTFDVLLAEQTQAVEGALLGGEKGINAYDKSFRRYKAGRVAKKMAQTAVVGLIIGGTIQEAVAFFKDDVQGMVEGWVRPGEGHASIQTPFEHIRGWISGNPSHMEMGHAIPFNFNGHTLNIPEGTSMINNADGTVDFMRGDQVVSSHFLPTFDANNELDAASVARLGQDGIIVTAAHQLIDTTKDVTGSAQDWIHNHPGETLNVHRDIWYANDTPMNVDPETGKLLGADLNELDIQWGGTNGINENGDAILNISHMVPGGSFQDGLSVDAQEAMNKGSLMAIIYLDSATQGQGIPVPIGADGNIIFDHNNPIMQQLFKADANGHMQFHGKFLEVVQKMGTDANGVEHIRPLSTLVGEGLGSVNDTISSHTDIAINSLSPTLSTELPMFVPVVARRPLGSIIYGEDGKEIEPTGAISKERQPNKESEEKGLDDVDVVPVVDQEKVEKEKTYNEMSQEEYDAMKDDIIFINKRIQSAEGIADIKEHNLKSEYGKKRYNDLKHIQGEKPITWNKTELQTIGDEMEGLLRNAKIVKKEKEMTVEQKKQMKIDIEFLNRRIQSAEGISDIKEEDLKSEYGKKRYNELRHIQGEKPIVWNKEELEKIATEMEKMLVGPRKVETKAILGLDGEPSNSKVEKVVILDVDGNPISSKKEDKEIKPEDKIEETKKEIEKSYEDSKDKEEESKDIEDVEEEKSDEGKERIFTSEDLAKTGTEFKNNESTFKIISISKGFLGIGGSKVTLRATNKETGEVSTVKSNVSALQNEFIKKRITITKVVE